MNNARTYALALIILLGLALRLYHLHNPILDHPAWRQGDGAAIARNFYELHNNIFYPQTDYDGPPPNYVELELQIVPFAAAQLYRIFGVHEIFARLLVIAFSLATIPLIYGLGRELYSHRAGLIAALLYAITPGVVYYGRAIIPESVMLFFCAGALLFWWRWCVRRSAANFFLALFFAAFAAVAKPPGGLLIFVPMLALSLRSMNVAARIHSRQNVAADLVAVELARPFVGSPARRRFDLSPLALLIAAFVPFALYFSHLHAIAEWHWATGITAKHVLPTLWAELSGPLQFGAAVQGTFALLKMLTTTILGPVLFALLLVAAVTQPADPSAGGRSVFFWAWFATLAMYAFVVVNVERVDYYLLSFVPFAVLYAAGGLDNLLNKVTPQSISRRLAATLAVAVFFTTYINMLNVHAYYTWSRAVYAAATEVRQVLEPGTLIVMGHYDPSVLYTIGHRGWEEDVLLWNVHDMTSAIHKGARYFVAVEVPRFKANKELYQFMQRYRRVPVHSGWQVYDFRHFAIAPKGLPSPSSPYLHR